MPQTVRRVALMIDPRFGYAARVMDGIHQYMADHREWRVSVFEHQDDYRTQAVQDWRGEGVIGSFHTPQLAKAVMASPHPCINITGSTDQHSLINVLSDDAAVGAMAADHFLQRGFRRFAFVGPTDVAFARFRADGFESALKKHGVTCSRFSKPDAFIAHLTDAARPTPSSTAVLAANDGLGANLLNRAQAAGLGVPDKLAVLGVGDYVSMCQVCTPSMSSIDIDFERRGYEAAALLDRLMGGRPAPKRPIRVSPRAVMTRQSTDILAIDDIDVIHAVRFIRDHATEPIDTQRVADEVIIGRRSLETRFKKAMGKTVHEEITRRRLERAQHLLVATKLGLMDIAVRSGFANSSALCNAFRRAFDQTPSTYRRQHRL